VKKAFTHRPFLFFGLSFSFHKALHVLRLLTPMGRKSLIKGKKAM